MSKITSYFDLLDHAESQILSAQASFFAAPAAQAAYSPYAAMELLDASFGVFNDDYLEAIASLKASLEELKSAKSALVAVKSMKAGEEKTAAEKAAKDAAEAAAARVQSVTDFAADVAGREESVLKAAKEITGAEGASADAIAAKLSAKVASAVGVSVGDIEAVLSGTNAELKASAQALAAKKLGDAVSAAKNHASAANKGDAAKKAAANVAKQQAEVAKKIADYKAAAIANKDNAKAKAMYEKLADNAKKTADSLKTNEKIIKEGLKGEYALAEQNAKAAAVKANANAAEAAKKEVAAINKTAVKEAATAVANAKKEAAGAAKKEQDAIDKAIKNMTDENDTDGAPKSEAEVAAAAAVENKPEYKASASAQLSTLSLQAGKKYILVDNVGTPSITYGTFTKDASGKVTYVSNDGKIIINDVQGGACLNKFKAALTDTTDAQTIVGVITGNTGTATVGDFAFEKANTKGYVTYKGHKYEVSISDAHSKFKNIKEALDNPETKLSALLENGVKISSVDGAEIAAVKITIDSVEFKITAANVSLKQAQDLAAKQSLANMKAAGVTQFGYIKDVNTDTIKYNDKAIVFGEGFDLKKAAALGDSGAATIKEMIDAGITNYDGVDFSTVENGYLTLTGKNNKKYKFDIAHTDATATKFSDFVAAESGQAKTKAEAAGGMEVSDAQNITDSDLSQANVTVLASQGAQELQIKGEKIGDIIHNGTSAYFMLKDGTKIKIGAVSPKAKAFKDFAGENATFKEAKALAGSATAEINGKEFEASNKLEGVAVIDGAKVADIAKFLKEDLVSDFAKIVDASGGATLNNSGDKGTLTNTAGVLTWKSKSNDVAFTIADGAKIADLEAIDSHAAKYEDAAKVAKLDTLKVGQTSITAANVPVAKTVVEKASLENLATYLTATTGGKISQLKAIVGTDDVQTDVLDAQGNKVGEINGNSGKADWTVANAITIKGLDGDKTVADLLKVKAGASWDQIKAVLADNAEVTVGENEFKYASTGTKLKLLIGGSSYVEVDTAKAGTLAALNELTKGGLEDSSGLKFDFGNGSTKKTLDLSAFKADSAGTEIATKTTSGITAGDNTEFTIKQTAGNGAFTITTDKFSGTQGKMVTINLEGFEAEDKLVLTLAANVAGGASNSGSNLTVAQDIPGGIAQQIVFTTAQNSSTLGKITQSDGSTPLVANNDKEALAIAAAIDADESSGAATTAYSSYLLKGTGCVYVINTGAQGTTDDALVVKLVGVPSEGVKWTLSSATITLESNA